MDESDSYDPVASGEYDWCLPYLVLTVMPQ